ncbi:Tat pathway signal protein [Aquabacterium sp. CECT 9606]|uniref:Acg family FMN-binding oxidoreductase n=1 Tax=Aquabacterium sp. CECT 9606 TaxID=2845822 RepID=UPI001E293CE7|nr:Tat pathway signal protein [Aquabacterium sp. CECT 9606]CAH0353049.1 Putative NAD(P)H nitroreductase [Aquabacterium sp. CECT 9606]
MLMRRQVVLGAAACGVLSPALVACSSSSNEQDAARALRRPLAGADGDRAFLMRELVRFATLAPSSHNTQCWTFHLQDQAIVIAPDLSRRCPAVDPDDHHLYVSLGCATENLAHAALAAGMQANARFDPGGQGAITVHLEATRASVTPLFQVIPKRQCTRGDYDGKPISNDELRLLERAGTGNGVRVMLLTGRAAMEKVLAYVVAGNTAQMDNPAFVAELKEWIRFSAGEAESTGDGLFAATTGNPTMPRWLASRAMGLFYTPKSENDRYARQIRNSAGIAVFASDASDKAHWIEAGRCYERFALQASALGLRNAFLNQPVEVGSIRPQFARALGLGSQRPDLVVRFGRGPAMPLSMRRPVVAVLV